MSLPEPPVQSCIVSLTAQTSVDSYASRIAPTRHHLKAWLEAAISGTPPFLLPTPPPVASALEQRHHPQTSARCACAQRGAANIQNYSRPQWLADGPTDVCPPKPTQHVQPPPKKRRCVLSGQYSRHGCQSFTEIVRRFRPPVTSCNMRPLIIAMCVLDLGIRVGKLLAHAHGVGVPLLHAEKKATRNIPRLAWRRTVNACIPDLFANVPWGDTKIKELERTAKNGITHTCPR